ncbi:hypothetical protein AURDEDRAFT_115142 [Auricularia subglabra TFB-10046 SS5]|nr:hypothetical protein AURDEDRAFT_115142 [Auricularia subglabra TFB-10046 SS5]
MDEDTPSERYLSAVMREVDRLYPLASDDSDDSDDEQPPTPDPTASMSHAEFMKDIRTSQTYAVMDRAYDPPPFPCHRHAIQDNGKSQWTFLKAFAYFKAKTLRVAPDSSLDAKADYLRAIIAYIRDCKHLPPQYTGDLAVSRILAGLAYKRAFRDRVHRMLSCNLPAFPEAFYEVLAYIHYNHADPSCYHRTRTGRPRRRVIVPEDVPLPPRSPSPLADPTPEAAGPPQYRERLYRTSIEEPDSRIALRMVAFTALGVSDRHESCPDAVAHHVAVVQAIIKAIGEAERPVATPYFENISDADLRAVFERDAAFAAVLEELKHAAAKIEHEATDAKLLNIGQRVVNHLCQPRRRTRATTRSVRFAPF